jgi:hypothetical protein
VALVDRAIRDIQAVTQRAPAVGPNKINEVYIGFPCRSASRPQPAFPSPHSSRRELPRILSGAVETSLYWNCPYVVSCNLVFSICSRTNSIQEHQLKTYCPETEQILFLRNLSGLITESIKEYQAFPKSVNLRLNFQKTTRAADRKPLP